ncbi:MAG: hypothetical protein RIR38_249, partial [Actinomycetota bacterium]
VQHDDERATGGIDALRESLVLRRHTFRRVDHQERDVRLVHRPQRAHE